jgi:hypothetical protein
MYSHSRPFRTDKPLWLDGLFLLVDMDYVSHSDSPLTLGSLSISSYLVSLVDYSFEILYYLVLTLYYLELPLSTLDILRLTKRHHLSPVCSILTSITSVILWAGTAPLTISFT